MAKTTKEEIAALGIPQEHFESLYENLKKQQKLPGRDSVPENEYTAFALYMKDNKVIDVNGTVLEEGLKVFDSKMELEKLLGAEEYRHELPSLEPRGGLLPCRSYRSRSGGGIRPCR